MNKPLLLAAMIASASAFAQGDGKEVVIKTTKLAGNVAMLEGQGGNIGVLFGDEGALIVDDQYAPLTAKIKAAVAELTPKPIRLIANTHWHGDHTGGNENLANEGAIIVAQDNVRARLVSGGFNKVFNRETPPAAAKALPVITYADRIAFHFNGEDVEAIHVKNAHTDGDVLIHFKKANVLHCGDTFFNGMYPFIDGDSGGSIDGYLAALEKSASIADDKTKVIPGHGPVGDKASILAAHHVLKGIRDRVKALVDSGKSVDEIVAAKPTQDTDAKWGQGFMKPDMFAKIVALSLHKK